MNSNNWNTYGTSSSDRLYYNTNSGYITVRDGGNIIITNTGGEIRANIDSDYAKEHIKIESQINDINELEIKVYHDGDLILTETRKLLENSSLTKKIKTFISTLTNEEFIEFLSMIDKPLVK